MTHINNLCLYFIWFILYSFIGWAYESTFYTIQKRRLVNTGFLSGPCCPIYGAGAMLDMMLLGHIQSAAMIFLGGMVVNCTLEYIVGAWLERVFHRRWWDYSTWPLNLHGRVCLFSGLAFGALAVILVRILHPLIFIITCRLSDMALRASAAVLLILLMTDLRHTVAGMRTDDEDKSDTIRHRIYLMLKR